jgi:hypothetical protein
LQYRNRRSNRRSAAPVEVRPRQGRRFSVAPIATTAAAVVALALVITVGAGFFRSTSADAAPQPATGSGRVVVALGAKAPKGSVSLAAVADRTADGLDDAISIRPPGRKLRGGLTTLQPLSLPATPTAKPAAQAAKPVQVAAASAPAPVRRAVRATTVASGAWLTSRVSWYGPGFYGHRLPGGGTLTPSSMVCAHKTLPFGTKVQFAFRGKTAIGEVRDRGPFVKGREFDLGPGVAVALGFDHVGVGNVQYRIIK